MTAIKYAALPALLFFLQIPRSMNAAISMEVKSGPPIYLSKTDPVYIEIKKNVMNDWEAAVRRADPQTAENQQRKKEMALWPADRQEKFETEFIKSLEDYNQQTFFNLDDFMMFFTGVNDTDMRKSLSEAEFRVRSLGAGRYVAEFWEDGLIANSEANAIVRAKELADSPRAKMHPEEDLGNVSVIKKTFAYARKAITSGKQKRYTELMAFLYIQNADKTIQFIDPGV
jgi:hypothetical protein